jgi:hypothetical protein
MVEEFYGSEELLKEFLTECQSDSYNYRNANLYKYNNLKIYMEPRRNRMPHFIVRIGISESMYDLETGERISGGLGVDERYVRRWIERNLPKMNLPLVWKNINKTKAVVMKKTFDDDDD